MFVEYYTFDDDTPIPGCGLTALDRFTVTPVIYYAPEEVQPSDCVWLVPNT